MLSVVLLFWPDLWQQGYPQAYDTYGTLVLVTCQACIYCVSHIVYVGLWYQAPFVLSTHAYGTSMVTQYCRFSVLAHMVPTATQAVPA